MSAAMKAMKSADSSVDTRFTGEIVDRLTKIVAEQTGKVSRWLQCLDILKEAGIATKKRIKVNELFVHNMNRNKLGLNWHHCHELQANVRTIGADRQLLDRACCFEMAPMGTDKAEQLTFNENLIERSAGLLAPRNGSERYLTVSCSHFCAGVKAALAACPTPEKSLRDEDGKVDINALYKDAVYKSIAEDGIDFMVVPWYVDACIEGLADLAQSALNAEHATYAMASELQCMAALAQKHELVGDMKAAIDEVSLSLPPCAEYRLRIICM
jgi:hypothetical protein